MRSITFDRCLLAAICLVPLCALGATDEHEVADLARSINALGLDIYREQVKSAGGANLLLSPYSISSSLTMAYLGADGETKKEMQRVLRLASNREACREAFQLLARQLAVVVRASELESKRLKEIGENSTPIELAIANRLLVQTGYDVRTQFIEQTVRFFDSEVTSLDFENDSLSAHETINHWVAERTHDRIRDLLPAGQPDSKTRLMLVNALYLRAAWANAFDESSTMPERFSFDRQRSEPLPMMRAQEHMGYSKRRGYTVVTLPYIGRELQLVLLVPDAIDGLSKVESSITADVLWSITELSEREVDLHLPRFKLELDGIELGSTLRTLGMRTAFDEPKMSANFDFIAPRRPDEYLYLGSVAHKTWLSLDERGTEASAATSVEVLVTFGGRSKEPPPVEVRVDRPFLFAIQHVESGACLFLGRVTDPR